MSDPLCNQTNPLQSLQSQLDGPATGSLEATIRSKTSTEAFPRSVGGSSEGSMAGDEEFGEFLRGESAPTTPGSRVDEAWEEAKGGFGIGGLSLEAGDTEGATGAEVTDVTNFEGDLSHTLAIEGDPTGVPSDFGHFEAVWASTTPAYKLTIDPHLDSPDSNGLIFLSPSTEARFATEWYKRSLGLGLAAQPDESVELEEGMVLLSKAAVEYAMERAGDEAIHIRVKVGGGEEEGGEGEEEDGREEFDEEVFLRNVAKGFGRALKVLEGRLVEKIGTDWVQTFRARQVGGGLEGSFDLLHDKLMQLELAPKPPAPKITVGKSFEEEGWSKYFSDETHIRSAFPAPGTAEYEFLEKRQGEICFPVGVGQGRRLDVRLMPVKNADGGWWYGVRFERFKGDRVMAKA